jgi:MFS family permease
MPQIPVESRNSNDKPHPENQNQHLHQEGENWQQNNDGHHQESAPNKSLCHQFVSESVWPGLGLFGESYLLFSIGTLKPIWQHLYPDCFDGTTCHSRLTGSLTYSVVLGVMVGMVVLGYAANHLGRRRGSIITASIMAVGAWGVTLVSIFLTSDVVWLYRSLSLLFFAFGVGVGGEYPLSASSASEFAMGELQRRQATENEGNGHPINYYSALNEKYAPNTTTRSAQHATINQRYRGRHIQLVFTMQGVGVFCNSLTMTALLWITGARQKQQGGENQYSELSLLMIWRVTYGLGALVLTYVLFSRCFYLKESHVWDEDRKKRENIQGSRATLLEEAIRNRREEEFREMEQPQLITTSSSVSSLSQPSVTADYHSQAIHTNGLSAQQHHHHHHPSIAAVYCSDNNHQDVSSEPVDDLRASPTRLFVRHYGLRLVGASLSWLLWDISFYGNKLFQSTFILALTGEGTTLLEFSLAASINATVALLGYFGAAMLVDTVGRRDLQQYGFLVTGSLFVGCGCLYYDLSSAALVTMYLASSFFGQLGPNATTFILAAELFPTEMRSMAHGVCAAAGKAGALIAAIMFNYMKDDLDLFMLSGYASFLGFCITFCTIPETLGLDLYEVDKKWRMTLEGRKAEYRGDANHPRWLSYFERSRLHGPSAKQVEVY